MEVKKPSLQTLQLQPGVLWKPFWEVCLGGDEKGLPVKIADKVGSFLVAVIRESLGKMAVDSEHVLMTG